MSQDDEAKALSIRLEDAWLALDGLRGGVKRTLHLTRTHHISALGDRASVEIGTFTRAVSLVDFREAVFAAFEELKGRN